MYIFQWKYFSEEKLKKKKKKAHLHKETNKHNNNNSKHRALHLHLVQKNTKPGGIHSICGSECYRLRPAPVKFLFSSLMSLPKLISGGVILLEDMCIKSQSGSEMHDYSKT